MNDLISTLLIAPEKAAFPAKESVLFALLCGLLIGVLPSLTDAVASRVGRKLGVSEETEVK